MNFRGKMIQLRHVEFEVHVDISSGYLDLQVWSPAESGDKWYSSPERWKWFHGDGCKVRRQVERAVPKTQQTEALTQLGHWFGKATSITNLRSSSMKWMAYVSVSYSHTPWFFGRECYFTEQNTICIYFLSFLSVYFPPLRARPTCFWLACYRIFLCFLISFCIWKISSLIGEK